MDITLEQLSGWDKEQLIYIDTRGAVAYRHGHIDNAVLLDDICIANNSYSLDYSKKYIVYCSYGEKSRDIVLSLRKMGYDVYNLKGGYREWLQKNAIDLDRNEQIRYDRQMILPEIGTYGQLKLKKAKVLIVGAGGLGAPASMYLAGAGIGQIGLMDADSVSLTNLQRQIVFNETMIHKNKAKTTKEVLEKMNSRIVIKAYDEFLTPFNAEKAVSEYDFIIDAADNFETKFLINDICVLLKKPFCHAGILKFQGQVMTCVPGNSPCYRCIFEEIPEKSSIPNCSEAGIVGAMAGIIGSIQALEAIKYFSGAGELLAGRMFVLDGLSMNSRIVKLPNKNVHCRVCGKNADIRSVMENKSEYAMNLCRIEEE